MCINGSNISMVSYARSTYLACVLSTTAQHSQYYCVLLTCMTHQTRATCSSAVTTSAGGTSVFRVKNKVCRVVKPFSNRPGVIYKSEIVNKE